MHLVFAFERKMNAVALLLTTVLLCRDTISWSLAIPLIVEFLRSVLAHVPHMLHFPSSKES